MGKLFNPDSPIMSALSKAGDWVILNILTVICSLPLITLGTAAAALYDAMGRLQRDEGRIYRAFFLAFRSNFKQATVQWLVLLAAGVLLGTCLYFYLNATYALGKALLLVTTLLIFLWCAVAAWVFPLQAKFYNTVRNTLRNALLCAVGYLPRTLVMVVLNMAPWALLVLQPAVFYRSSIAVILIWFALAAHFNLQLLKKPFQILSGQTEPEQAEE